MEPGKEKMETWHLSEMSTKKPIAQVLDADTSIGLFQNNTNATMFQGYYNDHF